MSTERVDLGSKSESATSGFRYNYVIDNRPIEVLIFSMQEEHVDEFMRIDHDVWTLGEASGLPSTMDRIPFLAKEVWLDKKKPGVITMHFIWESREKWEEMSDVCIQKKITKSFR